MSGRKRIKLADGRFTTFRKTLARRAPITPPHLREAWQLSIQLPDDDLRFFGLNEGPSAILCVQVHRIGSCFWVQAEGKHRTFVIEQMVRWLRHTAYGYPRPINGTLHRPGDPDGPTLSGPRHGPETYPCQITVGTGPSTSYVRFAGSMRSMAV